MYVTFGAKVARQSYTYHRLYLTESYKSLCLYRGGGMTFLVS